MICTYSAGGHTSPFLHSTLGVGHSCNITNLAIDYTCTCTCKCTCIECIAMPHLMCNMYTCAGTEPSGPRANACKSGNYLLSKVCYCHCHSCQVIESGHGTCTVFVYAKDVTLPCLEHLVSMCRYWGFFWLSNECSLAKMKNLMSKVCYTYLRTLFC